MEVRREDARKGGGERAEKRLEGVEMSKEERWRSV